MKLIFIIVLAIVQLHATELVNSIFMRYERPFTFLGIGKGSEKDLVENAPLYPQSVFIQLAEQISLPPHPNILALKHRPSFQDIQRLSSCEHVDVLLLHDPISLFQDDWKQVIKALKQMSHILILAWPKNSSENVPLSISHENRDFFYSISENESPFLLKRTTLIHPRKLKRSYEIHCDYRFKHLKRVRPDWTSTEDWHPGINMMTYLMFNGCIPSRKQVLQHIPRDSQHTDWTANNMIMQGEKILLIDVNDPISSPIDPKDKNRFNRLEEMLSKFILSTSDMSPQQTRDAFISIYGFGTYFDQDEIDE